MVIGAENGENEASSFDELDLAEDDSLPWLEADEEDEGAGRVDLTQIIGLIAILLVVLAVVVGAIFWASNRGDDAAPVADGSTIEAPEGPIKERPEDPGGKEFAGTGNVAPGVGEGQTTESQIGDSSASGAAAGKGGSDGSDGATGTDTASTDDGNAESAKPQSSGTGVGVQLAAYSSRARAEQGWSQLSRQTSALSGVRYRIVEGTVDSGTVYRLQAVANDRAAANALCQAIKADGLDCAVK